MKKGLIFATALAMALGVGAAVGAHQAKVLNVKATDSVIYLKPNIWASDSPNYEVYAWGGANGDAWVSMTTVANDTGVYKAAIPSDRTGFSFVRMDPSKPAHQWSSKWNQTVDLSFTAGKPCYKVTDWGSEKSSGAWEAYTEPATTYSVDVYVDGVKRGTETIAENGLPDEPDAEYGKAFSGWFDDISCSAGHEVTGVTSNAPIYCQMDALPTVTYTIDDSRVEYSTLNLYAFEASGEYNAAWPGAAISNKTITVPNDATIIINDGTHQTVNVTQSGTNNDILRILVTVDGSGHNNAAWASADTVPATDGYYIVGTASGWGYANATKLNAGQNGNLAQYLGYIAVAEEEFKVRSYINGVEAWHGWTNDGNYVVGNEPEVLDIYINQYGNLWVEAHQEPAPDPVYTMTFNGNTINFANDDANKPEGSLHQYKATIPEYAWRARTLEFFKDGVAISNIGVDYDQGQPIPGNNIWGDSTNGFKIYSSNYYGMDVYLKEYENGYSLWGTGYSELSFQSAIMKSNGDQNPTVVDLEIDDTYVANETYIKQYKTSSAVAIKALAGTSWDNSNDLKCEGVSEDINFEAGDNNARQAFQVTAWKVHNDCTEVIYVKMKADLSLWMYVGGYEEAHVLTIGGQTINMEKYGDDQYRALGVELDAGDEVTSYTIEGVSQAVTAKVVGNNNLNADLEVIADATADIYYDINNHTLHVSGLPTGGYHIYKNSNSIVQMTATDPYEGYTQYKSELITFAVNDTIQFIDCAGEVGVRAAVIFNIGIINAGGLGGNFEVVKDNNEVVQYIRCKTACSAAVYMKLKTGVDEVYFGQVEQYIEDAKEFADGFESAMAAACSAQNKQDAVEAAWALQATAFGELSSQAQAELKKGALSSVEEVREFGERYLAIKQQHSDWELDNFLSWSIPSSGRLTSVLNTIVSKEGNIAIIVVAIASVSFISLAVYIALKKRKQQ